MIAIHACTICDGISSRWDHGHWDCMRKWNYDLWTIKEWEWETCSTHVSVCPLVHMHPYILMVVHIKMMLTNLSSMASIHTTFWKAQEALGSKFKWGFHKRISGLRFRFEVKYVECLHFWFASSSEEIYCKVRRNSFVTIDNVREVTPSQPWRESIVQGDISPYSSFWIGVSLEWVWVRLLEF